MLAEPFQTLLSAAILAPSGDNTQPWRFEIDAREVSITVCVDESRDQSPMNAGQRMARIACGAAIENILRTAVHNNWNTSIEWLKLPLRLATIHIDGSFSLGGSIDEAIRNRHTNRWPYNGQSLSAADVSKLTSSVEPIESTDTLWITDTKRLQVLGRIIGEADAEMFGRRPFLKAFLENVRQDLPPDAPAPEGLPTGSLGLKARETRMLPLLGKLPPFLIRSWPLSHGFKTKVKSLVSSACGVCVIYTSETSPDADVGLGMMLERCWLRLTELGFAVQPMMSLPVIYGAAACEPDDRADSKVGSLVASFQEATFRAERSSMMAILRFGATNSCTPRSGRRPLDVACRVLSAAPRELAPNRKG